MCILFKIRNFSHAAGNFSRLANQIDEFDENFRVVTRRYTRKLGENFSPDQSGSGQIGAQRETDSNHQRHTKMTKSTIQSLELSSKTHLTEVIEEIPFKVKSNMVDMENIEKMNFSGWSRPIEGGLGDKRAERRVQNFKLTPWYQEQDKPSILEILRCAHDRKILAINFGYPISKRQNQNFKNQEFLPSICSYR